MSTAEPIEGQETLPAEFPEPVLTCDLIIKREIKDAFTQWELWTHYASEHRKKFELGDKSDASMAAMYRYLMHLNAYIGSAVTVDLLRTIEGMAPGLADDIARQFDWAHESGESGELLWDWATERGLDPDALTEEAKAEITKKEAT
ncbi:hypothetical protein SEA_MIDNIGHTRAIN_83 [Arthrobacter phage MidnightRain]|nr:hypothetical protein SEA_MIDNIGHTRAIN_83 [Arthrobacter phage MidnightRain]